MDEDEIARWAKDLTPDGAPGFQAQRMREFLGDAGYEKAVAQSDAATNLHLDRMSLINNLMSLGVMYGTLYGLVGLVAAIVLVIRIIF